MPNSKTRAGFVVKDLGKGEMRPEEEKKKTEEPVSTGYKEYYTIKYTNNKRGIINKDKDAERYAKSGWDVVSESIEQGKFKGGDACCLGVLCLPLAFLAGHTQGYIVVTYGKK